MRRRRVTSARDLERQRETRAAHRQQGRCSCGRARRPGHKLCAGCSWSPARTAHRRRTQDRTIGRPGDTPLPERHGRIEVAGNWSGHEHLDRLERRRH